MREYRTYQEFLQSPEWKAKREEVKRRAKGRCERCDGPTKHCAVCHHTTYKFGWDCPVGWLAWLCCECHDFVHRRSTFDPANLPCFPELEAMIAKLGTGEKLFGPKDGTEDRPES